MTIGKRLKEYLNVRNLTQEELSITSKVNKQTISNIVKNKTAPSGDVLTKIAAKYADMNLNWLVTGRGNMFCNGKGGSAKEMTENALGNETHVRELLNEKERVIDMQNVAIEALRETLRSQRELIDKLKNS